MLPKRKQVLCTNCGFMGWQTVAPDDSFTADRLGECRPSVREDIQTGGFLGVQHDQETGKSIQIHCLCNQWILFPQFIGLNGDYTEIDSIKELRQCLSYIKYEPGYTPEEHKALKRQAATKRTILISSLLSGLVGAVIGAAAAIIVQLIST